MKWLRKAANAALWTIVGAYAAAAIATHVPAVQSEIGRAVASALEEKLGTGVSVGRIDLGFFNRLVADDLTVLDKRGEKMLKVSRLSAKIDLADLLGGRVNISSAQVFGAKAKLYRENASAQPNYQFVVDSLSGGKSDSGGADFTLGSVVVRRSSVSYDQLDAPRLHGRLDARHLAIGNISGHVLLGMHGKGTLSVDLKRLSLDEESGLSLKAAKFKFSYDGRIAKVDGLELLTGDSRIAMPSAYCKISLAGGKPDFSKTKYAGRIHAERLSPGEFSSIHPGLSAFTSPLSVSFSFSGGGDFCRLSAFNCGTADGGCRVESGRIAVGFAKSLSIAADLDARLEGAFLQSVKTIAFPSDTLPPAVSNLQELSFIGKAAWDKDSSYVKGKIGTNFGAADVAAHLSGGRFGADISTMGLDLGKPTGVSALGEVAGRLRAKGTLPKHGAMDLEAKGSFSKLSLNGNELGKVEFDCVSAGKTAEGNLSIDGSYAAATIWAEANLSATPHYKVEADVKSFAPNALGIVGGWQGKNFSLTLSADLEGKAAESLQGKVSVARLSVGSGDSSVYLGNIDADISREGNSSCVTLGGDFIDGRLQGVVNPAAIKQSAVSALARRLPSLFAGTAQAGTAANDFTINATIKDGVWLRELAGLPLQIHSPLRLAGRLSDVSGILDLEVSAPSVTYGGGRYKSARAEVQTRGGLLYATAGVESVSPKGSVTEWGLIATAAGDNLYANASMQTPGGAGTKAELKTKTAFSNHGGSLSAAVDIGESAIHIGDTKWDVKPSKVVWSRDRLEVDGFALEKGRQHIRVDGVATRSAADTIVVDLEDVDVAYVLDLVNFHSVHFGGRASGKAAVSSIFSHPEAAAAIVVDKFTLEGGSLGTLYANATLNNKAGQIDIGAAAMDGTAGATYVSGYVSPQRNSIDLGIRAQNSPLEFIGSFCSSFVDKADLRGEGELRLHGPLSAINLTGEAAVSGSIGISSTGVEYSLSRQKVRLTEGDILLDTDTIYDSRGNRGVVNGAVHHRHLSKISYDIGIDAERLLVMDFKDFGGQTFKGTVYGTGACSISGRSGETIIDVDISPIAGSEIVYNASSPDAIRDGSFVDWGTAGDRSEHSKGQVVPAPQSPSDVRLNMVVNATPDATLKVLMDERSGDFISLHGNGAIKATYYNKGGFEMYGNYAVESGTYKMTIQNVVKREFAFQPGSYIAFGGDPYNAALNLNATYHVSGVSLADLDIGRSFSQNNVGVDCLMGITGTPEHPMVDFGIDLPTANSDANAMVKSLMGSQEELNQQVFYLLAVGRFYQSRANNIDDTGRQSQASLAMQSIVSGTLSQQINNVLSGLGTGGDWTFGANISPGDDGFYNAEYEGMLSGSMLSGRLVFNGQFGYRENPYATSNFIGDFDISYKLVPSGNVAVKVYNKTNDRYFTRSALNTQGIGLVIKKDFNTIDGLFGTEKPKTSPGK